MVPLVIPEKARPLMEFLADREVRRGAGASSNPYMFANQSMYDMYKLSVCFF